MKQTFAVVIFLLLLLTGAVYFFIPSAINGDTVVKPACSVGCVQRMTGSFAERARWLPKEGKQLPPNGYLLDGCTFLFGPDNTVENAVNIRYKKISLNSLLIKEADGNSTLVKWMFTQPAGKDPFSRISDYQQVRHINTVCKKIATAMQEFLNSKKSVYGFNITRVILPDSTLITLKDSSNHYPMVEEIYINIDKLKMYAAAHSAGITNQPMLNIEKTGEKTWTFMVGLPVNKALENSGNILAKRMFAGGKILETENLAGGFASIENYLKELENYRADYAYRSPAIPFQLLVTDRTKEPDSSKWQTRLYYPVF
jgi:hypothetical protein